MPAIAWLSHLKTIDILKIDFALIELVVADKYFCTLFAPCRAPLNCFLRRFFWLHRYTAVVTLELSARIFFLKEFCCLNFHALRNSPHRYTCPSTPIYCSRYARTLSMNLFLKEFCCLNFHALKNQLFSPLFLFTAVDIAPMQFSCHAWLPAMNLSVRRILLFDFVLFEFVAPLVAHRCPSALFAPC